MNAPVALEWLADLGRALAPVAGSALAQSTAVLLAGLSAAACLRNRSAALQSAVLRATLAGVVLCPVAAWTWSSLGVAGMRVVISSHMIEAEPVAPSIVASRTAEPEPNGQPLPAVSPEDAWAAQGVRPPDAAGAAPPAIQSRHVPAISAIPPTGEEFPVEGARLSPARPAALWGYTLLAIVWPIVTAFLMGRLALANLLIGWTKARATPASPAVVAECRALARTLSVRMPAILVSAGARSPCLVGWWKPAILLPAGAPLAEREVFVHELAHLKRRDCLWLLLGNLVCAVLWFQPLLWWLARRIERAADDVCDDYALQLGSSRENYARRLVEIAEQFQPGWAEASAAAGIVSFRSSLGQRVARILDDTRRLSVRVRWTLLLIVLVAALGCVLAAGLLGVGSEPVVAADTEQTANAAKADEEPATATDRKGEPDSPPAPRGELRLRDGQVLTGRLAALDTPDAIGWLAGGSGEPIRFPLSALLSLRFPKAAEAQPPEAHFGFDLPSGNVLFGKLLALDADTVELEAAPFGKVSLPRDQLREMFSVREGKGLLYAGPHNLAEWSSTPNVWRDDDGDLFTTVPGGSIYRDFGLPAQSAIELVLSWAKRPEFLVCLGVNADDRSPRTSFRMEAWARDLVLLRETSKEADVASLTTIPEQHGRLHLSIYLDQSAERCLVFSDSGELLSDLKVASADPGNPHAKPEAFPGLRLTNKRGDLRLERLQISRWDGKAVQPPGRVQPLWHLADGSLRNAPLAGFDPATNSLTTASDFQGGSVALSQLARVQLPSRGFEPPDQPLQVVLQNGSRLTGSLQKVAADAVWLASPVLKQNVRIPLSALKSLRFRVPDEPDLPNEPPVVAPLADPASGQTSPVRAGLRPPPETDHIQYSGIVLDAAGEPVAGAQIYVAYPNAEYIYSRRVTTADDGRFDFAMKKAEFELPVDRSASWSAAPWTRAVVVATAPRFGPAFVSVNSPRRTTDLLLKLPADNVPIRGQVVTPDGKAIPNVQVTVDMIAAQRGPDGTPRAFDAPGETGGEITRMPVRAIVPPVTTDADGRFEMHGIGRERTIELHFSEPTIESRWVRAMTRHADARVVPGDPAKTLFGATFVHTARPSRSIIGRMVDDQTGQPIAGIYVSSHIAFGQDEPFAADTTNERGVFRLTGLSRKMHQIIARPPPASPYFERSLPCDTSGPATESAGLDIRLRRGIVVQGRLRDQAGIPLSGYVTWFPLRGNPHVPEYSDFLATIVPPGNQRVPQYPYRHAAEDSTFQIPVLPGPGVLLVTAGVQHPRLSWSKIRPADRERAVFEKENETFFNTLPEPIPLKYNHAYQLLELPPDSTPVAVELVVDTGER